MEIKVSQEQGKVPITVFHIQGDIISGDELEATAREAYDAGTRNILIDLTGVKYLSSAGLRALHAVFLLLKAETPGESFEAMRKGIARGTFTSPHLKLLNPSPLALKALQTTGYDMFIDIFKDYKKAIESF